MQKQPPEMFYEKTVFKDFTIFARLAIFARLGESLFLIKLLAFRLATLFKKDSSTGVFL